MSTAQEMFRVDALAAFCTLFVCLYTVLTAVYAWECLRGNPNKLRFYAYLLSIAVCSVGALLADQLVLFVVLWGALAVLLYLMIAAATGEKPLATAQKALIMVGGADALMVLGVAIAWDLAGRPNLLDLRMSELEIGTATGAGVFAFFLLLAGALAKAGGMPLHTWVPDMAEHALVPATAFLPASLDKLLGIYLAARLSIEVFVLEPWLHTVLMGIGSVTILAAVMMALVQHDLKRLLGYHAVSQVGYMLLGLGTGSAIGIAGGLFHMVNNSVYKTALFFAGGAVEHRTGTGDLNELGGLSRAMPISFVSFAVASLAIAGVPPLNGFYSKWMIYQALVDVGRAGGFLWMVWLAAAMFGSALTLASFLKLLHCVFLGQPASRHKLADVKEVPAAMWAPAVVLAAVCVVFGLLPRPVPLRLFIFPSVGGPVTESSTWNPLPAGALLFMGLVLGGAFYFASAFRRTREVEPFVGGEYLTAHPSMRVSGAAFYETIERKVGLGPLYRMAKQGVFDPYDAGIAAMTVISRRLSGMHNGALPRYLAWSVIGLLVVGYALVRGLP